MATRAQRAAYIQKIEQLTGDFENLEARTIARNLELLQTLEREIRASLMAAGDNWTIQKTRQQLAAVDRLIAWYETQAARNMETAVSGAYELGGRIAVDPLVAAGAPVSFIRPTPAQINTLTGFSVDLVGGITADINRAITLAIRRGALGQSPIFSTMQQITSILGIQPGQPQIVKGITYRAERIARTETGRVFNIANFSQQSAQAEQFPEMEKRWTATGDNRTRRSHLAAHGQQRPIREPFQIGGADLMYPLDPAGPAKETVNCRCRTVTVHPEIGYIPTPLEQKIDRERDRRRK